MADYWKSQPRKFCQYCKCWIADNKPSIEFHERGKNHKENVAAKITEIKKKSVEKMKQEQRQCKQFAAMEEAAMKAYQEDLKRMEMESGSAPRAQTTAQPQPQVQPQVRPQVQPQVRPQVQPRQKEPQTKKTQVKKWKPNKSPKTETKTPVWVEGKTEDGHTYYYNTITGDSQWTNPESLPEEILEPAPPGSSSSGSAWMEGVSPEGHIYYYNTETGESTWEKPADFQQPAEGETQSEPLTPQPEPLSGGEESPNAAQASQEAEVTEQTSQQPKVPKISFRKRKAEDEPSEQEEEDKASDDRPEEAAEQGKKEEEVQSTTAEPKEEKKTQAKKPKTINPYGTWEQIQEEEDPYASVDLQLPQVEGGSATPPAELPPEPKPKFKERIITSLGEEGGPASFKKNRTQSSKSRSLRQRDNDD